MPDYSIFSDQELLTLLSQSDAAALTEIHARYNAILYAHAYKRYPHREEVRDLLQDLFIYLWDHRKTLTVTTGLSSYLYMSVRNRLVSLYRKQKVRFDYAASLQWFMDKGENITDERLREKELLEVIHREIALLPSQMRLVFELSRNQNLSHDEIAVQLNLSPHTVRTQVRNALRILRIKLRRDLFFLFF